MSGIGRCMRFAAGGLMALALAGCQSLYRNHGWAPTDADLAAISVGTDTRETVAQAVGAPGTAGLLEDSGWYYVQSRYEHYGWREPREIDRQVVAITFDDSGVVQNIERFGLADGEVVTLSRRVTDSNTRGVGFLRQLFGNFGRVNTGQLVGAPR